MVTLAIFGGTQLDGSTVEPGERVTALALFGGVVVDFAAAPPAPAVDMVIFAVFGGVEVKVRPDQDVRLRGFSLFGGRSVEPRRRLPPPQPLSVSPADDDIELPLEISAYAVFGGVSVKRDRGDA